MFRIFAASDIHASDIVFRKFVNAGNHYKADALFFVGDITGKALVLVVKRGEGPSGDVYEAEFLGIKQRVVGKEELNNLLAKMADRGYYYKIVDQKELDSLAQNEQDLRKIMHEKMAGRVEDWMKLAVEVLKGTNKKLYMITGNDDPRDIMDVIRSYSNDNIVDINEKLFQLDNGSEGFGIPYSNMTPWKLPGDIPEEALDGKIKALASKLKDPANSLFVIHVPPVDTVIDQAPLLEDLHLKVDMTGIQMAHVGSTSVRSAIQEYQPVASLHGHIHESRGLAKIGKTQCFNAGSEYEQGVLRGVVINIDGNPKKVKSYLFASG